MAIITPQQLLGSLEANAAGVTGVSVDDAERAIRVAEAVLNRSLGYRVHNADESLTFVTSSGDRVMLPERVRTISEITDAPWGGDPVTVEDTYEIRNNGFTLYRRAGWRTNNTIEITGEFGYEPTEDIESMVVGDDEYVLGQQFVILLAVRLLQRAAADIPAPGGAVLTNFSSESASFQFFTPSGDSTGYQDLDILLDQIGRHPTKRKGLYTIGLGTAENNDSLLDFNFTRGRL